MVDDDVVAGLDRDCVVFDAGIVARPHTQIANDHVVRMNIKPVAAQGDAVTRRCLPCNRYLSPVDIKVALKVDDAGDLEHDGTRTLPDDGLPQAPGTAVGEVRYLDDPPAAAADSKPAKSLCSRK